MRKNISLWALLLLALASCNKATDFGNDLITGTDIPYFTTDTFTLMAQSIPGDSIRTYVKNDLSSSISSVMLGSVDDPAFGLTSAELFTNFTINKSYNKSLNEATIDSVVWDLYYGDTSNLYGNVSQPMNFNVYRISGNTIPNTLYSNQTLSTDPNIMASLQNFQARPYPKDSSYISIKFNEAFSDFLKILPDSAFSNTEKLLQHFSGLNIRPDGLTGGLININLLHTNNSLTIYFKEKDSTKVSTIVLKTIQTNLRHVYLQTDITNSLYAKHLADPAADSLLFIQAMNGPRIRVTLPPMDYLRGNAVNFAELELTVAEENGSFFSLPGQLFLFKKDATGQLISTKDGQLVSSTQGSLLDDYGGKKIEYSENGKTVYRYKIRLPNHISDYIRGNESNELYISVLYGAQSPGRAIFKGVNAKVNPMKLKLIVSRII